jgi:hypothetical protein
MIIKNILHIYALLICLITTIILIINFSLVLNSLTSLAIPDLKYASTLREYDSNETYIKYKEDRWSPQDPKLVLLKSLSPAQLDSRRAFEREKFLVDKKAVTISDLIMEVQWIMVAGLFFFIHWRLYKRSKE